MFDCENSVCQNSGRQTFQLEGEILAWRPRYETQMKMDINPLSREHYTGLGIMRIWDLLQRQ